MAQMTRIRNGDELHFIKVILAYEYPLSCGNLGVKRLFYDFKTAIPRNWQTKMENKFNILSFSVKIDYEVKNLRNQ